jgi:hypothetical protein
LKKQIKGFLAACTVMALMMTGVCSTYAGPKDNKPEPPKPHEVAKPPAPKPPEPPKPDTGLKPHEIDQLIRQFSDVSTTHWAYIPITDLCKRGIIVGFADNTFKPNDIVTRSQFAVMLTKALGLNSNSSVQTFKDVPEDSWDYKAVEAAKAYLTGYKSKNGDLLFYGSKSAVREDMAVALVKALDLTLVSNDKKLASIYDDFDRISENLRDFVYTAYEENVMVGSKKKFNPQGSLTRAEAAALLSKIIERMEKVVVDGESSGEKVVTDDESSDATLCDLVYNNIAIEDFSKYKTEYVIELSADDEIPTVDAEATDSKADVSITQAKSIPGTATVVVTAENGAKRTYKVRFVVKNASSDATLSYIKYDGTKVKNFDEETTFYTVKLSDNDVPKVTAKANDSKAEVTITQAADVPGYAKIVVVAEDGTTKKIYYVKFIED